MKDLVQKLHACQLFRALSEESIRQAVLPLGVLKSFPKQTIIISPQDKVNWFGLIIDGQVQITQIFSNGNQSLMEVLSAAQLLGIDLICTRDQLSPYHAIASADTQILLFPADIVLQEGILPEADRSVVYRALTTLISHENMRKYYHLTILSQRGLRDRILSYLFMQARRQNTNSLQIPFSREELADYLCVNRSALSHELSLMEQEGLIQFRKNRFTILES